MELTPEQKQKVAGWIADGLKLSDVQKRLADEAGLHLTYMEARLLVDDLRLTPQDPAPATVPTELGAVSAASASGELSNVPGNVLQAENVSPPTSGRVSIKVDDIARPATIVSGTVTFSDGKKAGWHLDQMGRLGMVPEDKTYRPPQADLAEFQAALERELARLGM